MPQFITGGRNEPVAGDAQTKKTTVSEKVLSGQSALADTCGLTCPVAEVIEAGATNAASGYQFNFLDTGIVQGESFFHTDTMGNLPHGIGGIHGAMLALDDDALENLDPFLVALNDADMHLYVITGAKVRVVLPHLFKIDSFDYCAHNVFCWLSIFRIKSSY